MKTREELEQIAREVVEAFCDRIGFHKTQYVVDDEVRKLRAILYGLQDEALNSVLPEWEAVETNVLPLDVMNNGPMHGAMRAYYFIRTNLKPAPQMPSGEEIETLINEFYKDEPNGYGPKTKLRKLLQKFTGTRLEDSNLFTQRFYKAGI